MLMLACYQPHRTLRQSASEMQMYLSILFMFGVDARN